MTEGKKTKDVIEIVKLWIPSCNYILMRGIITGARGKVEKMKLKRKITHPQFIWISIFITIKYWRKVKSVKSGKVDGKMRYQEANQPEQNLNLGAYLIKRRGGLKVSE